MLKHALSVFLPITAVAIAAAACGSSGGYATGTPTTARPAVSPAANSTPSAAPSVAATTGPAATGTAPAGTALAVIGKDLAYDKSAMQAAAGTVTIQFDNEDAGVTHDFHLFTGTDSSGASVGMTPITTGPDKQTLTVDLSPGSYFYHCDIHPGTMHGVLTVS